ncbi:hemolysin III family protein [Paenibacillus athensensis]|uniref:Hemolysin D n=1 Tax=Paenibacillus athensensis TaxID=1967502 RepID=A0A4Y8QBG8_9BACL|nr:hemolysin III family protein [Paenibacillus athensensis]MCD1257524.1 hemolysin III family protein [Paenibacillus athensensis]
MEYTLREEKANAITHGLGVPLSAAALAALTLQAALGGDGWHLAGAIVFGAALLLLYVCSTLLHSMRNPRLKDVFEVLDHAAIYVLIAGTYTPFLLVTLRGPLGWSFFGVIWGLAATGIVLKLFYVKRFVLLSTLAYIAMGWLIVLAFKPLVAGLPTGGIAWLVAGGILYTFGSLFYVWRRVPHHHAVWHVFVLAGSAAHFIAIYCYV